MEEGLLEYDVFYSSSVKGCQVLALCYVNGIMKNIGALPAGAPGQAVLAYSNLDLPGYWT